VTRPKLTDRDIVQLRTYRQGGWSHLELGRLFNISPSRSSEICRGKGYANSGGPIETSPRRTINYITPRSHLLKATPEMAQFMREARASGLKNPQIARKIREHFGVELSVSLVQKILKGRVKR
jgi:hypothetical protein